jgi:GrpB-like predicted nucleotidyltransferase (UPF0157 family)
MTKPVIIEDYDPTWPHRFETLRSRIAAALGPLTVAIEHVGSTAVPGLAAKPIIDLDVLLRSDADLVQAIAALRSLGYEHRGTLGILGREAFHSPPNFPPHHLYVCPPDSPAYREHIAFRDHLRAHPDDALAYATLKRQLAANFTADREAYTQAKTEFVQAILQRTRAAPRNILPAANVQ